LVTVNVFIIIFIWLISFTKRQSEIRIQQPPLEPLKSRGNKLRALLKFSAN